MTKKLPELRPAHVTIVMKDGSRFEATVETNRGDWQDPYSPEQLVEKYMGLAGRLWPKTYCLRIREHIQKIEQASVFDELFIEGWDV